MRTWWPGCPHPCQKEVLGVSATAAAHSSHPAELSLPPVFLLFSFFSFFFNHILIEEAAKALRKKKKTNKINEQHQGRGKKKKAFSGRSPWHG